MVRRHSAQAAEERGPHRPPHTGPVYPNQQLVTRLLKGRCELCGRTGDIQVHHVRALADLDQPGQPQPHGPRPWPRSAASPSWSATTAMTRSTGSPPHHSRSRSPESRIPGNGSVRFGGRPGGKGPAQLAPRRPADPTQTLQTELLEDAGPFATIGQAQAAVDTWRQDYNTTRPHQSLDMASPADRFRPCPGGDDGLPLRAPADLERVTSPPPRPDDTLAAVPSRPAGLMPLRSTGWSRRRGT